MTETTQPLPAAPVIDMKSTELPPRPGDTRPTYVVHAANDVPPPFEPRCPAGCWCRS